MAEEDEEATFGSPMGSEENITEDLSDETEQHVTQDSGAATRSSSNGHSTRKSIMDSVKAMVSSSTTVAAAPATSRPSGQREEKPSFMRRKIRRECVSDFQGSNSDMVMYLIQHLDSVIDETGFLSSVSPFTMCDFACFNGLQSLDILETLVELVRDNDTEEEREIEVIMNDLPENNWSRVDRIVKPKFATNKKVNITYEKNSMFMEKSSNAPNCHLGWGLSALHWVTEVPDCNTTGYVFPNNVTQDPVTALMWKNQYSRDWAQFLKLRSSEFRPGAVLVLFIQADIPPVYHTVEELVQDFVEAGKMSSSVEEQFVIKEWCPSTDQLMAPLNANGECSSLWKVETYAKKDVKDTLLNKHRASIVTSDYFAEIVTNGMKLVCGPVLNHIPEVSKHLVNDFWSEFHDLGVEDVAKHDCSCSMHHLVLRRIDKHNQAQGEPLLYE